MKLTKTLLAAAVGSLISLGTAAVAADDYPNGPITIISSFKAGGNADINARLNADALSKELGVPVNVVNKPGGAHIPAAMSVVEGDADGYTLFQWSPPSFMVVPLTRDVPYSPADDFIPLFADQTASNALYVRADSPYQTVEDLIAGAKENRLTIGVNGLGAPPNLSAVQFASEFGLEFITLALKTVPGTMTGLIGGQIDVAVGQTASKAQFGDEVRALVILNNDRLPYFEEHLPGIKTIGETFPGKNAGSWIYAGLAVKVGTPDAIVEKLRAAAEAGINNDAYWGNVPATITSTWQTGPEVTESLKNGIALYSPILDGLGLLNK